MEQNQVGSKVLERFNHAADHYDSEERIEISRIIADQMKKYIKEGAEKSALDYIFAAQVLLHVSDVKKIVARLFDLLNPGGHLLIVDFDKNESVCHEEVHNGFDQKALIDMAKDIGFREAESDTFYHGKNMFMNQDASLFLLNAVK